MDFNTIPTNQSHAAGQPCTTASSSRSNTPSAENHRLEAAELGSQNDDNTEHAADCKNSEDVAEQGDVTDVNYEELDALEYRVAKRMDADRKNRLFEIYWARLGSKIQRGRSVKARQMARDRRFSQDDKRQVN